MRVSPASHGAVMMLAAGIHATRDRIDAPRRRMLSIVRRTNLAVGTVNASGRGMSLAPRTVSATGDRMNAATDRLLLGWRTVQAIRRRIRADRGGVHHD